MKKKVKEAKDMTADEVIAHVFHPKVAKHMRKLVKKLSEEKTESKK
jgi:IS1 family transposase